VEDVRHRLLPLSGAIGVSTIPGGGGRRFGGRTTRPPRRIDSTFTRLRSVGTVAIPTALWRSADQAETNTPCLERFPGDSAAPLREEGLLPHLIANLPGVRFVLPVRQPVIPRMSCAWNAIRSLIRSRPGRICATHFWLRNHDFELLRPRWRATGHQISEAGSKIPAVRVCRHFQPCVARNRRRPVFRP
jgi:hypothetical protein